MGILLQLTLGKMAWVTITAKTEGTCVSTTWVGELNNQNCQGECLFKADHIEEEGTIKQIQE